MKKFENVYQVYVNDSEICGCLEHDAWVEEDDSYFTSIEKAKQLQNRTVQEYIKYYGCKIVDDLELQSNEIKVEDKQGRKAIIGIGKTTLIIDPEPEEETERKPVDLGDLEALAELKRKLEEGD